MLNVVRANSGTMWHEGQRLRRRPAWVGYRHVRGTPEAAMLLPRSVRPPY